MSVWTKARAAAMRIVMPPMTATRFTSDPRMFNPSKNTGYSRATRNTPATTMVEECSSDETGVGPAMASGSQVWSGNWPDLPIAAMNSATAAAVSAALVAVPDSAHVLMAWMLNPELPRLSLIQALLEKNRMEIPTSSPTSPTRTVKNAFSAARLFAASSHQCPMSMNEQRPMISHPRRNTIMFSAETMASMPEVKSVNAAK